MRRRSAKATYIVRVISHLFCVQLNQRCSKHLDGKVLRYVEVDHLGLGRNQIFVEGTPRFIMLRSITIRIPFIRRKCTYKPTPGNVVVRIQMFQFLVEEKLGEIQCDRHDALNS